MRYLYPCYLKLSAGFLPGKSNSKHFLFKEPDEIGFIGKFRGKTGH
jgi:hypothetical protein